MDYKKIKNVLKITTSGAGRIEITFPTAASRRDAVDLLYLDLCPCESSGRSAWVRWARDIHECAAVREGCADVATTNKTENEKEN